MSPSTPPTTPALSLLRSANQRGDFRSKRFGLIWERGRGSLHPTCEGPCLHRGAQAVRQDEANRDWEWSDDNRRHARLELLALWALVAVLLALAGWSISAALA
jgi:hypothetical protein